MEESEGEPRPNALPQMEKHRERRSIDAEVQTEDGGMYRDGAYRDGKPHRGRGRGYYWRRGSGRGFKRRARGDYGPRNKRRRSDFKGSTVDDFPYLHGGNSKDPLNLRSVKPVERPEHVEAENLQPIEVIIPKNLHDPLNLRKLSKNRAKRKRRNSKLAEREEAEGVRKSRPKRAKRRGTVSGSSDGKPANEIVSPVPVSVARRFSTGSIKPRKHQNSDGKEQKVHENTERRKSSAPETKAAVAEARQRKVPTAEEGPAKAPTTEKEQTKTAGTEAGPAKESATEAGPEKEPAAEAGPPKEPAAEAGPAKEPAAEVGPAKEPAAEVGPTKEPAAETKTRTAPAASSSQAVEARKAGKDEEDAEEKAKKAEKKEKNNQRFRYGNYDRYYGNRLKDGGGSDPRMRVLKKEWFENKLVLDIGCNAGFLTLAIAKEYQPRNIIGIDIDAHLVGVARKNIRHYCDKDIPIIGGFPASFAQRYGPISAPPISSSKKFPNNVWFRCENYVLEKDELLDAVKEEFDVIMALSITKWIHLNWGDAGIKRFFKRIFRHLRPGGLFILEPQSFDSYRKRAKMTEDMNETYRTIEFMPNVFQDYLTEDVGFSSCQYIDPPRSHSKGFERPIQIYRKRSLTGTRSDRDKTDSGHHARGPRRKRSRDITPESHDNSKRSRHIAPESHDNSKRSRHIAPESHDNSKRSRHIAPDGQDNPKGSHNEGRDESMEKQDDVKAAESSEPSTTSGKKSKPGRNVKLKKDVE